MIRFSSRPILRKNTLGFSGTSHLSSPSTSLTRGLAARRLFTRRVPPCFSFTTTHAFSGVRSQASWHSGQRC
ncbi:hypothetical protein TNCV_4829461 [Trichonephila clavipes]|nr:hypothetical protein TNCV_4829461 [Trichonephila clavipes]